MSYYGDWKSFEDMVGDFEGVYCPNEDKRIDMLSKDRWQNIEVLFAAYTYQDYEGDALVIFKRNGQLYEVNGGHCSCYGLSERSIRGDGPDQWEPEETTKEALLHRLGTDSDYGVIGRFKSEIRAALESA